MIPNPYAYCLAHGGQVELDDWVIIFPDCDSAVLDIWLASLIDIATVSYGSVIGAVSVSQTRETKIVYSECTECRKADN